MPNRLHREQHTSILYNEALFQQAPFALFETPLHQTSQPNSLPGRGSAHFFVHGSVEMVLKRYRRGGYPGRLIQDAYAYLGLKLTRMWREFHLLDTLHQRGLPVPVPVAARCRQSSLVYRGELITVRLPNTLTLAQAAAASPLANSQWHAIGQTIARFHQHDVFHADLNAHNFLLDQAGTGFLVDFDKGAIRPHLKARWTRRNLNRLLRSLRKCQRQLSPFHFAMDNWARLLDGYQSARP